MKYTWRSIVATTLFSDITAVYTEVPVVPINFTAILIEIVNKFQLQGRLFALHISYIVLGLLSVLFMFGLPVVLLSEHQLCKKKEEEDAKTMELVPHDIFEVHYSKIFSTSNHHQFQYLNEKNNECHKREKQCCNCIINNNNLYLLNLFHTM
ncbi:putative integral membrane protein [Brugia pahangi]